MKRYGALFLAIVNVILWVTIYLNDFYEIQFYFDFGGLIVAVASIVWAVKSKEMKFRKLTYGISGIFLALYGVFWTYIILYAMNYSI